MTAPPELAGLRARLAEIADLRGIDAMLGWDQNTHMPPGGADARAEQMATVERLVHARLVDPELGRLLDALEPWTAGREDTDEDAALVRWARRDHEKAVRVPADLAEAMARESALGYAAWLEARETGRFATFRDSLARHVDLRHRYAACFPDAAHPYDVLLDDYEPGETTANLRPIFATLVEALTPLVQEAAAPAAGHNGGVFDGDFPEAEQRAAITTILGHMGFEDLHWRLDPSPHPFALSPGSGDFRITTRYRPDDFAYAFYSALHEFGHGLYESGIPAHLRRTNLGDCASLGIHESQSRTWENIVGRGRPFCAWLLPQLQQLLPGRFDGLDVDTLYRGANTVQRSLIRTESDETTYNLHVALRFEIELALLEGRLEVDDLPAAWNEAMVRMIGVEPESDLVGVLQDVHWSIGSFGYFPTYTLGNLMAAQMWARMTADVPDLEDAIARGDFGPLRQWLVENVHVHGRKLYPRDLLRRATGQELAVEPLIDYLRRKLADAGIVRSTTGGGSTPAAA